MSAEPATGRKPIAHVLLPTENRFVVSFSACTRKRGNVAGARAGSSKEGRETPEEGRKTSKAQKRRRTQLETHKLLRNRNRSRRSKSAGKVRPGRLFCMFTACRTLPSSFAVHKSMRVINEQAKISIYERVASENP